MKAIKLNSSIVNYAILAIAIVVLAQNVFLLKDNRSLKNSLDNENFPSIPVNKVLRNMSAGTSDGQVRNISMPVGPKEKLLIITFSPGCPICQAAQPAWAQLSKELKERPEWHVLWVSRDPIKNTVAYCKEHQIPLEETVGDPTYRTYMQLALKIVPNTVVVGMGGRIEKVWAGPVGTKERWNEIVSYLDLQQKELPLAAANKDMSASTTK